MLTSYILSHTEINRTFETIVLLSYIPSHGLHVQVSPVVKASDLGAERPRFDSKQQHHVQRS